MMGVPSSSTSMLLVKTHWDLNYETTQGGTNLGWYLRRFVTPKKYYNNHNPYAGGSLSYFLSDMMYSGCTGGSVQITTSTLSQSYVYYASNDAEYL
jgi:hypothetical protein